MRCGLGGVVAALALSRERVQEELTGQLRAKLRAVSHTPEYAEIVADDIKRKLHAKQLLVIAMALAGVRFIAGECSRRAGKTHLAAALIVLTMLRAKRGQEVVFCAPTLARGKDLIWDELTRMVDEYNLDWKTNESSGRIRTPNGARFRIVGLDNKKQIGKVSRGGNTILFVTDETQEFPQHLEALLVAVGPALAQSRGVFLALGTPTKNESDYWAAICDGAEGFQRVHWTLLDNPFLGRDADEILAEERERHGWSVDHPDYVRELLGRRCSDPSSLVLEFDKSKNLTPTIPGYNAKTWRHWIGIDFGFRDTTAWVVLTAPLFGPDVYVVHCEQEAGLDWDEVTERTHKLCETYTPKGIVGDSATGGLPFIESFNKRYSRKFGVRVRGATKHDKPASISVMNTELRKGRLRLLSPATDQLAKEATALQWEDTERTKILEGKAYPEDLFDAWRYAFVDFNAFRHDQEAANESDEDRRIRERNERAQRANGASRRAS